MAFQNVMIECLKSGQVFLPKNLKNKLQSLELTDKLYVKEETVYPT